MLDAILQTPSYSGLTRLTRRLQNFEAILGMNLLELRSLAQLRRRISQNSFVGRAVVQSPSLHVDQSDHVGGVFRHDLEQFLFLLPLPTDGENAELLI